MVLNMVIHQSLGCMKERAYKCIKDSDCSKGLECWKDVGFDKYEDFCVKRLYFTTGGEENGI